MWPWAARSTAVLLALLVLLGGLPVGTRVAAGTPKTSGLTATLAPSDRPSQPRSASRGTGAGPEPPTVLPPGWNVTIANKGNQSDYPPTVTSGHAYRVNVSVTTDVPSGATGTLVVYLEHLVYFSSPICNQGSLDQSLPISTQVAAGSHSFRFNLTSNASVVPWDSPVPGVTLVAGLSSGTNGSISLTDTYPFDVTILPVTPAPEVAFRANVLAAYGFEVYAFTVSVVEVYADPTGNLSAGMDLVVRADAFPVGIFARDIVDVKGDINRSLVCAWRPTQGLTWLSTWNHRPALTDPTVSPPDGREGTNFTFAVTYGDLDGDAPQVSLVVDGAQLAASKLVGEYSMGATFVVSTTLSVGDHTVSFTADDQSAARNATNTTPSFSVTVRPLVLYVLLESVVLVPAVVLIVSVFLEKRKRKRTVDHRVERDEE